MIFPHPWHVLLISPLLYLYINDKLSQQQQIYMWINELKSTTIFDKLNQTATAANMWIKELKSTTISDKLTQTATTAAIYVDKRAKIMADFNLSVNYRESECAVINYFE